MKDKEIQFNKSQKNFSKRSLSDVQKKALLSSIYDNKNIEKSIVSPFSSYFVFFKKRTFSMVVAVVMLLISGTSYAAVQSLPGDLLYPVKTEVLEPIGLMFRFSEESKNEYKIKLLEKRVQELEELERRDKFNIETKQESDDATNKKVKDIEEGLIFDKKNENNLLPLKMENDKDIISNGLEIKNDVSIEIDTGFKVETDYSQEIELSEEAVDIRVEDPMDVVEIKVEVGDNLNPRVDL